MNCPPSAPESPLRPDVMAQRLYAAANAAERDGTDVSITAQGVRNVADLLVSPSLGRLRGALPSEDIQEACAKIADATAARFKAMIEAFPRGEGKAEAAYAASCGIAADIRAAKMGGGKT